jgi:hypothetical protein
MAPIPERRTRKQRVNDSNTQNFMAQGMSNYDDFEPGVINSGEKIATTAKWYSTAASKTPSNKGSINPFQYRQKELASGVFEQTDYSEHKPSSKKKDDNNESKARIVAENPLSLANGKTRSSLATY